MATRTGITTGTCAAAAAKAAAMVLCGQAAPRAVEVALSDSRRITVPMARASAGPSGAVAAVTKDAGDDPDVTDGLDIVVAVSWDDAAADNVVFAAGEGVGTVTKPGLQVPVGEPAINPVPRQMIRQALREVTDRPVRVEISIPLGREVARRTFNPRLGIVDGLSILGTSGIVRPYSAAATQATIRCSLGVARACGVTRPVLVPGNIGARAARRLLGLADERVIEVSNEWDCAVGALAGYGFEAVMVLGHPGKLAKLAGGHWNTHSSRSPAAVGLVAELAVGVLGRTLAPATTVDGLFKALPAPDRRRLGDALAAAIARAVREKAPLPQPPAVVLIDMKTDLLGHSGDLDLWR